MSSALKRGVQASKSSKNGGSRLHRGLFQRLSRAGRPPHHDAVAIARLHGGIHGRQGVVQPQGRSRATQAPVGLLSILFLGPGEDEVHLGRFEGSKGVQVRLKGLRQVGRDRPEIT